MLTIRKDNDAIAATMAGTGRLSEEEEAMDLGIFAQQCVARSQANYAAEVEGRRPGGTVSGPR